VLVVVGLVWLGLVEVCVGATRALALCVWCTGAVVVPDDDETAGAPAAWVTWPEREAAPAWRAAWPFGCFVDCVVAPPAVLACASEGAFAPVVDEPGATAESDPFEVERVPVGGGVVPDEEISTSSSKSAATAQPTRASHFGLRTTWGTCCNDSRNR
jgi:hypothetical protein